MGLNLSVGILVGQVEGDPEDFEPHSSALRRLNRVLVASGLPPHHEPDDCVPWEGEMISYSGLHDVRRIAAYLDCGEPLPAPARGGRASDDPVLEGYFAAAEADDGGARPGVLARLFGRKPRYRRGFDHLLLHGDAEGYYLPIDFADVLFTPLELEIPGIAVGSAPRLLAELERIAVALRIPDHLTAQSDELWEASDDPPDEGELWRRYPDLLTTIAHFVTTASAQSRLGLHAASTEGAPGGVLSEDRVSRARRRGDGDAVASQSRGNAARGALDRSGAGVVVRRSGYGRESFGCVTLREGCRHAIAQRAALVFT